ncbi:MAG TPA: beta-propeller fold lactonase family protein [Conexibacter sp.]|nr:beta-propeller fold lactonase family protein [Conexibacter sp.]
MTITPDGRNVYVASSGSDAIAVFRRNARTGALTQGAGTAGCIAARGAGGCASAVALDHPNSVAVSPDGRNVYATALNSDAVVVFKRNARTGRLTQTRGGCVSGAAIPGCAVGRAFDGPDVVVVSPDGKNIYVGSFFGNAVVVLARDSSSGALAQPPGTAGCIGGATADGCAAGLALGAPEGLAISGDGDDVYVGAALSNALDALARDPSTGALTQATDGSGCIVNAAFAGCTTGVQLGGANAVAVSPDDGDVYVTSLTSNSLTNFTRTPTTGQLAQQPGTSACAIYVLAVGCSLGRALQAPEGLAVSPDGATVYATAFKSSTIDVFDRNTASGALLQKPRHAGCITASALPDCTRGRALGEVSSIAVSPDGRHVYVTAFASDAVSVFKRVTRTKRGS